MDLSTGILLFVACIPLLLYCGYLYIYAITGRMPRWVRDWRRNRRILREQRLLVKAINRTPNKGKEEAKKMAKDYNPERVYKNIDRRRHGYYSETDTITELKNHPRKLHGYIFGGWTFAAGGGARSYDGSGTGSFNGYVQRFPNPNVKNEDRDNRTGYGWDDMYVIRSFNRVIAVIWANGNIVLCAKDYGAHTKKHLDIVLGALNEQGIEEDKIIVTNEPIELPHQKSIDYQRDR